MQNRRTFLKRAAGTTVVAGAGLAGGPLTAGQASQLRPRTGSSRLSSAPRRLGDPRPELESFLRDQATAGRIPGFAVSVVAGSRLAWGYASGKADQERGDRMTLLSSQAIASVTKTWSTTAVLRAQEQGLVDLDAPLDTYLPFKVRNPGAPDTPITLRQILTHTSSLGDGPEPGPYGSSYRLTDPHDTLADEWAQLIFGVDGDLYDPASEFFYETSPGDEHIYANSPWSLCAAVLREVTATTFARYCAADLFSPLDLRNTSFLPSEIGLRSTQHALLEDGEKVPDSGFGLYSNVLRYPREGRVREGLEGFSGYLAYGPYGYPAYPDGGLYSNAIDVARYLGMWMNEGRFGGRRVLKPSTVRRGLESTLDGSMTDDEGGLGGRGYIQCLGWEEDRAVRGVYFHHGEDLGTRTAAAFALPQRVGAAVITNVEQNGGFDMDEVLRRLFAEFGGPEFPV